MSERYDALERLQRLRESGALTDEEFQAEKRRLLGYDNGPAVERVTEVEAGDGKRSRTWLYVLLGAGGLAIAIVVGLLVGRTANSGHDEGIVNLPAPAEAPADTNLLNAAPPQAQDIRTLPKAEQLARAFAIAFGGAHGQATVKADQWNVVYKPKDLFWIGDRAVLISAGPSTEDCHACAGALAVHYLKAAGETFEVTGAWPNVVSGSGWGAAPEWKLTKAFTSFPAIYEEGGFTAQGCTSSGAFLVELAPSGPIQSGLVRLGFDDSGGLGDRPAMAITGKITNVKKDISFDVAYTGGQQFVETWIKRAGKFVPAAGETKMPQC
jgi:hypothetical protein